MGKHNSYKLKVSRIVVYTNLEVQLNSRTTKEEANKEVERLIDAKNINCQKTIWEKIPLLSGFEKFSSKGTGDHL